MEFALPHLPPIPRIVDAAGSLTDVPGIRVGHASDWKAATGLTVVLCEKGAVCGLDVRGGASGLRNPSVTSPGHRVTLAHAVFFAGGSAFGLDAGAGIMRYLESRRVGFRVRGQRIPIVTGAILYDLGVGNAGRRPDPPMAYRACRNATRSPPAEGSVGAGTGATVGKIFGIARGMKGGVGSASLAKGRLRVAALAVVNAFGDIRDPNTGLLVAGARNGVRGNRLLGTEAWLREGKARGIPRADNTTLAVVATNAQLDREQASRLAMASHVALARCVAPAHTLYDGDLVFSLATGGVRADPLTVETMAVEALCNAILRGVVLARGVAGVPSWRDLHVSSA